jgi:endonuclease/exonuclease/phosphatase (EEP) superfamily protein YafD
MVKDHLMKIFLLVIVAALAAGACSRRTPQEPGPGSPCIKVVSYNVNYGLAGDEATMDAIEETDADLVLLQETTQDWEEALTERFSGAYKHMKFIHCCGAGGLGIMSRYPFEEQNTIDSPSDWFPAWHVTVTSPVGKLQVLNVHLHPPVSESGSIVSGYVTTPKVRLEEIRTFYDSLDPDLPTIIAGDFNENKSGKAVKFLSQKGFRTVLPEYNPGEKTWRWKTSMGTVTWQLDHIMYNDHLKPLSAMVLEAGRSDHLPIMAVFERE